MARLTVLFLWLLTAPAFAFGPYSADLVRVMDGDTMEVVLHLYPGLDKTVKVRLTGAMPLRHEHETNVKKRWD